MGRASHYSGRWFIDEGLTKDENHSPFVFRPPSHHQRERAQNPRALAQRGRYDVRVNVFE
jgi:hypothetical protein